MISYYGQQTHSYNQDILRPGAILFPIMASLVNAYILKKQGLSFEKSQASEYPIHYAHALHEWVASLPEEWEYYTTGEENQAYQNYWIAKVWNYYRLARILNEILTFDNVPPNIINLERDIYGSLPFMLGSCQSRSFTADLYFVITILQTLCNLTDKTKVIQNLSDSASPIADVKYEDTKNVITRLLC